MCGQFGSSHATAAISSTNPLINLIIQLFMGISVGANVLMARCFGAGDREKGQRVVYTSMIFCAVFGVAVGIFGVFTSRFFLELMGTPDEVLGLSTVYLEIFFAGLPFLMIYNFGSAILRATGDTKRPFFYLSLSGVFNVALNLLFVICFRMDVAGVALATVIAEGISAVLIVRAMLRNQGFFRFRWKEIRFYPQEGKEIVLIGLPAGLQGAIFSLSNVLLQSSVNSLGTDIMDGNGAACALEGFVYTAMNSVAQGAVAFISANYGKGNYKNIPRTTVNSTILVILMNALVGGVILLFCEPLVRLYVQTDAAVEAGVNRIFLILATYFLCGIMDTLAYSLRGIGYSLTPTIVSLIGACGLRVLWIYIVFPLPEMHTLNGLMLSYPVSWAATCAVHLVFYLILLKKAKRKLSAREEQAAIGADGVALSDQNSAFPSKSA